MNSILIVDDDAQLSKSLERLLVKKGYSVRLASSGEAGLKEIEQEIPGLVIMDLQMPGMDGLETFQAMRKIEPRLSVVIMTGFGTTDTAIEATKMGAYDYVFKPFETDAILGLIEKAFEAGRLMRSKVQMDVVPETAAQDVIIGRSPAMQEVYKTIGRVASTDATVLVRGESGTGKELVARAIYQHGLRAKKSFTVINCVAIPETLLESELFGYEKGAFTGASSRRLGKIEKANDGTVLLDEIGDMPLSIQAKILRLLQEKMIERLGGNDLIPVDVNIIAATNRNLEQGIIDKRFREDLFYRLNVVTINLPPLRDRKGDVSLLCDYFLNVFSNEMSIDNPGMTDEARATAENHSWPGNVRQLANTLQKAMILCRGYPIRPADILESMSDDVAAEKIDLKSTDKILRQMVRDSLAGSQSDTFVYFIDHMTNILITEALTFTRGNRSRAAKLLGISRSNLLDKVEKFGLDDRGFAEESE